MASGLCQKAVEIVHACLKRKSPPHLPQETSPEYLLHPFAALILLFPTLVASPSAYNEASHILYLHPPKQARS